MVYSPFEAANAVFPMVIKQARKVRRALNEGWSAGSEFLCFVKNLHLEFLFKNEVDREEANEILEGLLNDAGYGDVSACIVNSTGDDGEPLAARLEFTM